MFRGDECVCRLVAVIRQFLVVVLPLMLIGCGYGFQGGGSVLPPDVKRVNIPLVENTTPEPGLAVIVTEALRDEFDRYGVVTVVEKASEADAVLRAKIVKVGRESRTVTSNTDTVLEYQAVMLISAELRRVTGPVLWRNAGLQVAKSFGTDSSVVVTSSADFAASGLSSGDLGALNNREISRGQEKQALEDLAEEVATKMYAAAVTPEF